MVHDFREGDWVLIKTYKSCPSNWVTPMLETCDKWLKVKSINHLTKKFTASHKGPAWLYDFNDAQYFRTEQQMLRSAEEMYPVGSWYKPVETENCISHKEAVLSLHKPKLHKDGNKIYVNSSLSSGYVFQDGSFALKVDAPKTLNTEADFLVKILRDYPVGTTFIPVGDGDNYKPYTVTESSNICNSKGRYGYWFLNPGHEGYLYHNGKWAEIIPNETPTSPKTVEKTPLEVCKEMFKPGMSIISCSNQPFTYLKHYKPEEALSGNIYCDNGNFTLYNADTKKYATIVEENVKPVEKIHDQEQCGVLLKTVKKEKDLQTLEVKVLRISKK
jgi:hypothetical protein